MKQSSILFSLALTVLATLGLSACQDTMEGLEPMPDVQRAGGSPLTRAATDTMAIEDFRRCYGVGFSYDGIWGERCNLRDVRSRVLDLDAIHKWETEEDWHIPLFMSMKESEFTYDIKTAFSQSEYAQNILAKADVEAELIIFNGEVSGSLDIWENGQTNDFYSRVSYCSPSMQMTLSTGNVRALIRQGRTELLTPNFREVIDWMDKHHDNATIDSFLVCYGSHIITRSKVGASLTIDMTIRRDSLTDIVSKELMLDATVKGIVQFDESSESTRKVLYQLNSADCNITVKGGDLSTIPNHLLHFTIGKRPNLSSYLDKWSASLNYDPHDYAHNNLEMTDIEVTPIWYFIPNDEVAKLVRRRVEGTAVQLIKFAGYQNFTNTGFKLPQSVTCKMGGKSTTFNKPATANVIASGRYVATICREQIDLPEVGKKELQVVYPIYNQQVNLGCGYTTYGDVAYKVRWQQGQCTVERDTLNIPNPNDSIYLTNGVPGSIRYANYEYQPCNTVIGYEWPLSIKKDGSLDASKPYYLTYKKGTDFLLRTTNGQEQSGYLDGLPNWTLRNGRMVRNKENEYNYYWNPNEVNYQ